MIHLIDELKAHHAALADIFGLMSQRDIAYQEQLEMVKSTKLMLLNHLAQEDEKLYPFLRDAAQQDKNLMMKLDMFDKNMQRVTEKVLAFYDKYENGWEEKQRFRFRIALIEVVSLLTQRIRVEEEQLYPEYTTRKENTQYQTKKSMLGKLKKLFGR